MDTHPPSRAMGPPPYLRRKSKHEVHAILKECHALARYALKPDIPKPDTS